MRRITENTAPDLGIASKLRNPHVQLVAAGLMLVGLHCGLARISSRFGVETDLIDKPVVTLVALELTAGAVFLFALYRGVFAGRETRKSFAWIVFVGVVLRGVMMDSSPMLESDFFRYLWDGAVVTNGMSPYRYAPQEVTERSKAAPEEFIRLGENSQDVIQRINHPQLRTIYPPLAQLAFAAAHFIKPWSLLALRIVLAVFDAVTAALLYITLKNLRLPRDWLVVYWWNPLLVLEVFNAAHMDVLALPFAVGACLAAFRGRHALASALLALGTGIKLWPVVLLPIVLASAWRSPRRLAVCVGLFGSICGLLFIPIHLGGLDGTSGFVAYGRQWEMNDALYMLLWWIAAGAAKILSLPQMEIHLVARVLAMVILGCVVAYLCRSARDRTQMWGSCLLAIAALFVVSPTQFPWYYLWVMPFMAIQPRFSLLLLGCLLPLYYLRFYFKARGYPEFFDNYIVWFEYLPAWIIFLLEHRGGEVAEGRLFSERHPTAFF